MPENASLCSPDSLAFSPGTQLQFAGGGFKPGSQVRFQLFDSGSESPLLTQDITAGVSGSIMAPLTVPESSETRLYGAEAKGHAADGELLLMESILVAQDCAAVQRAFPAT